MIGKTVSHYEIISRLGGGGMGVVYKAYDTALKRHVALKFLPADLTRDEAARKRFTHEAQAAAALDHPNICTVHEIGQSDGNSFIVMPLVEGESLREKLERGPLPVGEALDLALQVGRGLSKAHGSGIVHRDIKPANVLLTTGGQAKIVDFGLAKLGSQTKLTKTGMTVGTVGYMSPEQAKGEEVDQRTDVWSLGVMLYEMLAGRLPFRGEMDAAMVYSILNEEPSPVTAARKEVPVALEDVVERALSKDTAKRYQTMDEMLAELERVAEESRLGIERKRYAAIKRLKRRKRLLTGTGAVLVIAIAAILLTTFYQSGQALDSIAVLPFENLSGADSLDVYADGVTGELIANFSRVVGFKKVICRSAAMQYKNSGKSPREIAEELGVKALVMGVVQIEGDNIKITPELIKGDSEELLWSDTFDGKKGDVLTIQGQIVRSMTDEVHVTLTPDERKMLSVERPVVEEALVAYLQGQDLAQVWTAERFVKALEMYERAIEIDSTFARPYAALAAMKAAGIAGPYQDMERAEALANKALELDPTSSQAHMALAAIKLNRDWDWEGCLRETKEAERLGFDEQNGRLPWHFYELCGYMDEAIELARKDLARDPANPERYFDLEFVYENANRPDDRIEICRQVLARFPDEEKYLSEAWEHIAKAYAQKGMPDSALAIAKRDSIDTSDGYWDRVYMAVGQPQQIQARVKWMEDYIEKSGADPDDPVDNPLKLASYWFAVRYSVAGDKEKAFQWLERAYAMRSPWLLYLNTEIGNGAFDNLLGDPRLDDLIRRVGMPKSNVPLRLPSIR